MIAIDIETSDPNLKTLGDGAIRKDGRILCVGVYRQGFSKVYEPDDPKLKPILSAYEGKIFHNGIYDLSWLVCGYGFEVNGVYHDTMTRASLIDEYADLDLDACCKRFKVSGKNKKDTIEEWFIARGGKGNVWRKVDEHWKSTEFRNAMYTYCQQDCKATYDLYVAQEPFMKDLYEPYMLECNLYPLILDMKKRGVRIDVAARDTLTALVEESVQQQERKLQSEYGITKDIIASPKKMTEAMNGLGIKSPKFTATGNQSWDKDALDLIDHPIIDSIKRLKINTALLSKYLHGCFRKNVVNERIHCTFTPNKREDGGTITGRFASSKPNLQNISAGEHNYGKEMRSLFLPEENCYMGAFDYGQIEYRLLGHFAVGHQAEWMREQIRAGVDFHSAAQEATGIKNRTVIKRLNFGIIYGMQVKRMVTNNYKLFKERADELGIDPMTYGKQIFTQYHARLPVISDTMKWIENVVSVQGYIKSIGGRIHHKPKAIYLDNGIWNTGLYKMTNYLIQGSAAEILKKGLYDAKVAGVFDVLPLHLTVHDENVVSIPKTRQGYEAAVQLQECMLGAYKERLFVPMSLSCDVGDNWGAWDTGVWKQLQEKYPKEYEYSVIGGV